MATRTPCIEFGAVQTRIHALTFELLSQLFAWEHSESSWLGPLMGTSEVPLQSNEGEMSLQDFVEDHLGQYSVLIVEILK
ncbi:hypothetical protein Cob_v005543 [Colletotrichum orbiculare MAFF 240422]|uniref:Uncharacterized protein n=1 Tax=Colletotrichum orbiculare (strain 104-T / ATCC 96160 / CBS 514.97 / LARS 414 / MAFF 240422) TaxID=1213857 RepID=A0A484FVI1_COLOR|nr:hypothetical protein Cob_v005543 [Colletotrichum orbiculare MAFF 240422]